MHIDDYSFGRIVIDGKTYTSDVIVYPDKIDPSWWRKQGHYLQEEDLADVVAAGPDVVIIGRGYSGVMEVPQKTVAFLESKGIRVFVEKTGKAVETFNKQRGTGKVVGAFHLTC
ncbi:MAG: Mth938-like domain-containing protein [Candidatus Sulfobium sp.]